MGGFTVSSLSSKWFSIAYADYQTVAKVGSHMQGWPWALSQRELPASTHAGGSLTSPGWPGHWAPLPALQLLWGPQSKGFPGAVQSCSTALPALSVTGAHHFTCHPLISPIQDQRCYNNVLFPFLRRQRLRAMLTNFIGSPEVPEKGLNHTSPSAHHPTKMPPMRGFLSIPNAPDLLQVC